LTEEQISYRFARERERASEVVALVAIRRQLAKKETFLLTLSLHYINIRTRASRLEKLG